MARKLEQLRNIGIIAHIDAGKTTVTERMLFYSGASASGGRGRQGHHRSPTTIPRSRSAASRSTPPASRFRGTTCTINLIDTPGHVDFTAEVERSLRVLDGGVVVFSAREGVEAQSETVWRQADKYGVPRIAFINKLDREGADFDGTFDEIRERLEAQSGRRCRFPSAPARRTCQDAFRGVIDLVEMKLLDLRPGKTGPRSRSSAEIPAELHDEAELWRGQMLEQLFEFSNELAELVLDEEPVPAELIRKRAARGDGACS